MSIRWKLAIFVFVVTVVPAILLSFFVSQFGARVIEQEVEGGFNLIARVGEAGVDQYFGRITSQAADWSSDGQIREYLAEINALAVTAEQEVVENGEDDEGDSPDGATSQRRASQEALSTYIVEQKHALSEYIVQTDIINSEGVVVASTNTERTGTAISLERLNAWYDFSDALEAETGQTFVNQIRVEDESEVHTHEGSTTMFHVSSPVDAIGDNGRGVLVNHIDIEGLNEVLRQHTKAPLRRYQGYEFVQAVLSSLELYLVRKEDRLMATSSRFEKDAELSRVVDTEPVRTCVEDGQSMNGVYQDYRGVEVVGASRCPADSWWVLGDRG